MHDKYLIADDWGYIWEAEYRQPVLGYYKESYNEDRDLLVYGEKPGQGSSFQALEASFMRFGISPAVRSLMQKGGIGGWRSAVSG